MAPFAHFFLIAFAVLVPLARGQATPPRPITELFRDINLENDNNGGCAYVGLDNLNRMVRDAHEAADGTPRVIRSYNTYKPGRILLEAFFNEKNARRTLTDGMRSTIRGRYTAVRDWLRNGGNINNNAVSIQPRFFCDSNFLIRKSMDDEALDTEGNPVVDGEGNVMRIRQLEDLIDEQSKAARRLSTAKNPLTTADVFPYWNVFTLSYEFDKLHNLRDFSGPCSSPTITGYTNPTTPFPYMVICPQAFGLERSSKGSPWSYRPMRLEVLPPDGQVSTVARLDNGEKDGIFRLASVAPTAVTFLHELFHLVLGGDHSYPSVGEEYKIKRILGLDFAISSVNPETYAQMAIALRNTLRLEDDDETDLYWHTGYATRD